MVHSHRWYPLLILALVLSFVSSLVACGQAVETPDETARDTEKLQQQLDEQRNALEELRQEQESLAEQQRLQLAHYYQDEANRYRKLASEAWRRASDTGSVEWSMKATDYGRAASAYDSKARKLLSNNGGNTQAVSPPPKTTAPRFSIAITSVTSPMHVGDMATLTAKTTPGARATLTIYISGTKTELESKIADTEGKVSWSWQVRDKTEQGSPGIFFVTATSSGLEVHAEQNFSVR